VGVGGIMQESNMIKYILLLMILTSFIWARSAPTRTSLRALGMGNAHVAVVDDFNALHYNPAGLNLLNRLGNYNKRPEMGYYPDNFFDARLTVSLALPDLLGIGSDMYDFYRTHKETLNSPSPEALAADSAIFNNMLFLDRQPFPFGANFSADMAFHNFGGSIWANTEMSPYIDAGIILPSAGIEFIDAIVTVQMAVAYGISDKWSVGLGFRGTKIETIAEKMVSLSELNPTALTDSVQSDVKRIMSDAMEFGYGLDLGVLYQMTREVRLGASLLGYYLNDYQDLTPRLSFGAVLSPRKLQRNTTFFRKINFAVDLENLLANDRNYKFFTKLNFGFEWEQAVLVLPVDWFYGNLRALTVRGAFGFKGGYWSMGLGTEIARVVQLDIATWAEEGGYFTGQEENRYLVLQFSFGL
jgi:hypothetical protein